MIDNQASTKFAILLIFISLVPISEQLKFSSVQIPSLVQRNSNFWLVCQFQLDSLSQDQLYSVKWYKNNEEFYRLIFSGGGGGGGPTTTKDATQTTDDGQQFKQQYFGQAGVNVMMGSSNATHVRLLNASLESEGVYACEISTQNLSTIRYEREIRVYVLPASRLSIIGFKNRYSLGESVALICASDFSRPKPALGWFINGRRITNADRLFELESQSKSKLNEPTLFRLTLGLKFKLTVELLSSLARVQRAGGASQANSPLQPLELQCRYKLAEVSDVTYNELAAKHHKAGRPTWTSDQPAPAKRRVYKRADQQVVQGRSPGSARQLWRAVFAAGERRPPTDACQLGALALVPDDPLIVEPETVDLAASFEEQTTLPPPIADESARRRRHSSSAATIQVNCSTISALEPAGGQWPNQDRFSPVFCSELNTRRRLTISGHSQTGANESDAPSQRSRGRALAYLSLGHPLTYDNNNLTTTADSADSAELATPPSRRSRASALLAPPLLEWFINNQEAPRASASYSPELPLVAAAGRAPAPISDDDDDAGDMVDAPVAANIDYAEYFANFDSRPIQQHLMLRLALDKKLFMTPDSRLKLRCSSTQAQVLAIDSASATILPTNQNQPQHAWHKQQQQQQPKPTRQAGSLASGHSAGARRSLSVPIQLLAALATLSTLIDVIY